MRDWLEMTARDPVCGRHVRVARVGAVVEHGGSTYFFCSGDCGHAFTAAVEVVRSGSYGGDGRLPPSAT